MTREEAIKEIKSWAIPSEKGREVLETLIPELVESEDERVRRELIEFIQWSEDRGMTRHDFHQAKRPSEWIAYLEKQKDSDMEFHEGYTLGFSDGVKSVEQKEPHYTKRNALFDKCVENCDPAVMKKVSDEVDEILKTEQKPEPIFKVGDKIKLKSEPKYPYREIVDIKNGAYYFDEAVYLLFDNQDKWEKEQKPVEVDESTKRLNDNWMKQYFDDYKERNTVTINSEPIPTENHSVDIPLPKWSEEDEKMIERLITRLNWITYNTRTDGTSPNITFFDEIAWLKSLRPSWRPSEEQMEALKNSAYGSYQNGDGPALRKLYEQLKKL